MPPVANFLGQMTDEVTEEFGSGAKMTEFYCTGPKSYCYKVVKPDGSFATKIKTKGIKHTNKLKSWHIFNTINFSGISQTREAMEAINFDNIKKMASEATYPDGGDNLTLMVKQQQFRSNKQHEVETLSILKKFQTTSDKRRIINNMTVPYGYHPDIDWSKMPYRT